MKIFVHLSLMLIPLFAFVAITSGILRYQTEKRELKWGVEEEGRGLAVALSAYLSSNSFEDLKSQHSLSQFKQAFRWGKIKNIYVHKQNTNQTYKIDSSGIAPDEISISNEAVYLKNSEVYYDYEKPNFLRSWVRINFTDSDAIDYLSVESDISHIAPALSAIENSIVYQATAVIFLSILFSYILSTIVSFKIRQLSNSLKDAQLNESPDKIQDGLICELNDLNNTFRTMDSLLRESSDNMKKSGVNFSKSCSEAEIAQTYNNLFLQPVSIETQSCNLILKLVNQNNTGDFFEIVQDSNFIKMVFGSFEQSEDTEIWRNRSAVQTMVTQLLESDYDFNAIETKVRKLFPEVKIKTVLINKNTIFGTDSCHIVEMASGQVLRDEETEFQKHALAVHNLPPENGNIIEEYIRNVQDSSIKALSAELNPILRNQEKGVLLLLGARG